MATTVKASVVGTVEAVTVATAQQAFTALKTAYESEVSKIEAVVQAHIGSHTAQAAAHNAEVSAAQAVLDVINPPATPAQAAATATQAAGFVLTAEADVSGFWAKLSAAWDKLGSWRVWVIGAAVALLAYGCHSGLIK